ncbi:MAG: hypothetical protein ACOY0T_30040 [Myxococcota bacterium]
MLALAALIGLSCIAFLARIWSIEEHCPPDAVCDGKGMLTALVLYFGLMGLALFGGAGGLLVFAAKRAAVSRRPELEEQRSPE